MIEELQKMTDAQAAEILERLMNTIHAPRMNGKVYLTYAYKIALLKAIKRLRGEE